MDRSSILGESAAGKGDCHHDAQALFLHQVFPHFQIGLVGIASPTVVFFESSSQCRSHVVIRRFHFDSPRGAELDLARFQPRRRKSIGLRRSAKPLAASPTCSVINAPCASQVFRLS